MSLGWKAFVLKEKLKVLKGALKALNHNVFPSLDTHIVTLREVVSTFDLKFERGSISNGELVERDTTSFDFWSLIWIKDS